MHTAFFAINDIPTSLKAFSRISCNFWTQRRGHHDKVIGMCQCTDKDPSSTTANSQYLNSHLPWVL